MLSDDEDMIPHVSSVLKLALTTFRGNPDKFEHNLRQLVNLFNKTTSAHVNLNPKFMKEATWKPRNKAPMSYIGVFNNEVLNIGIFILKPNMILPLHNHPQMYGLLKVIAGTVRIKSFTIKSSKSEKYKNDERLFIIAERNEDVVANESSECCILDPVMGNIHEIETGDDPAAFIDILSPPYERDDDLSDRRKCSYFRVLSKKDENLFELMEVDAPSWFWSDSSPYTGPVMNIIDQDD